jgi:hypothetical protein
MTVDERNRLQLAEAMKRVLGDDEGITLMELLPPVGWADVATRHDLLALEQRIDLRFDRFEHQLLGQVDQRLRSQAWMTISTMIAVGGVIVAAIRL